MNRLSRRQFAVGAASLGLVAGCGRLPWQGQEPSDQAQHMYRVGYLTNSPTYGGRNEESLWRELQELGYVEGSNLDIQRRYAEQSDQLPEYAAGLVAAPFTALVTVGGPAARAAKTGTSTIPIVGINLGPDPVSQGLIANLAHPGGNLTGFASDFTELVGKRLQLLKEVVPGLSRVAVLGRSTSTVGTALLAEAQAAADVLGISPQLLDFGGPQPFPETLRQLNPGDVEGLLVTDDNMAYVHRPDILKYAALNQLPAIYPARLFPDAGGLMSYGADDVATFRRAAHFVDRILKGAKPADLPVEQPMTFEFVVNMKTARELGITFPPEILLQVTEVIE